MRDDFTQITRTPFYLLFRLLTDKKSLEACILAVSFVIVADLLFEILLFPAYSQFLVATLNVNTTAFQNINLDTTPIVWVALLGFITGTLVIVITFAAQNIPKLIDLYMEERWSLLFIWMIATGGIHVLAIKLLKETGISRDASALFNLHLLGAIGLSAFPYTFHVLRSTKAHYVIDQIIAQSLAIVQKLSQKVQSSPPSPKHFARVQKSLFEMLNQLDDLLVYVPFKEPKANIIQGVGRLLSYYVDHKKYLPSTFFQISPQVQEDISFKTLDSQLEHIEEKKTFYEQKGLRLIGNAYHTFLETNQFDLSSLCSAELSNIGLSAIKNKDQSLVELIMVRFNTHFRHAIKHGQRYNEPRNLYNLAFHYGQFIRHLVNENSVDNVKTCFFYLRFYTVECFKNALNSPSLAFILDTIAAEMAKILMQTQQLNWDLEVQKILLNDFLLLDNPQGVDRKEVAEFFITKNSVRVVQIGLGLYYLENKLEEFALEVVKDTLQDLELMDETDFLKLMQSVFNRLRFSGPTFWEDTDRGNLNIYYTPHANQIEKFQKLQSEQLHLLH
ncbi:MAG: hypothetical protein HQM14_00730 [SAR324 cluster bacterium]|nr:hypothetical protein [SAR324 cluster bacterium]